MTLESDPPSTFTPKSRVKRQFTLSVRKMMVVVVCLGCFFGVVTLLSRAIWHAREDARRADCVGHLAQLALAVENYRESCGKYPPAYIADKNGKPMHSWRVLILPFIEQQSLYAQYDFGEPWDGPNNIKLLNMMPGIFDCPSRDGADSAPSTLTNYVVVSGPGTMFPGAKSLAHDQIADGLSGTLMLVEASNAQIPWTKPQDLSVRTMSLRLNDEKRPGISSPHPSGANVMFGDRHYRFLRDSISPDRLRATFTISRGKPVLDD